MSANHIAEHAAAPQGGWRDDLRQGVGFVLKRRVKLVSYTVTAAGFLVNNGYVHGTAQTICNIVLVVAGFVAVDRARNASPRPRPRG